jgi:hypothetical protein
MINDNSLGDRLNAVKKGSTVPKPPMQPQSVYTPPAPQQEIKEQEPIQQPRAFEVKEYLLTRAFGMFDMLLASFLYGFAIKTIFSLDWNLLGAFAVGFFLNHAISVFPRVLFPKRFRN